MHYGVSYYPEQEREAGWETDARLIAEARFTTVRLAEFAWRRLEPRPGQFDFAWLDRAIDTLAAQGLAVVLGTPTAVPPQWFTASHPEALFITASGTQLAPQSRRFVCVSGPAFRAATERIVTAMAERYGRHQAVIGWQIDNELGCHNTARCYCDHCRAVFRDWLRRRYGSLDALNTAWGTVFWSQEYDDWGQIQPPLPTATTHNPGHTLDFYRCSSESVCEYAAFQAAILRDHSREQFVCHNFMGDFDQLDYAAMAPMLDLIGFDNYVPDGAEWDMAARLHDQMRGFKHQPFWVLESPPGQVNWRRHNPDLRHGEARLRSLQAVARGADGMFYFQWRAFRGGAEQMHSAILPHDGVPGRAFSEAAALGADMARLRPAITGTSVRASVAVLADADSSWALQIQPHNAELANPTVYLLPWYRALLRRNIAVEFCRPDEDLSGFRLVIAPSLHMLSAGVAANLRRYVEGGGTLILGPRSGFKEPSNRVTELPLPGALAELVGVRVAEWASLPPGERRTLRFEASEQTCTAQHWRELLELRGASAVAHYTGGDEDGEPAVACNRSGTGRTLYVGALGDEIAEWVLEPELATLSIAGAADTPPGVEACVREDGSARYLFLLNHTPEPQRVALDGTWHDLLAGEPSPSELQIAPLDVRVLRAEPV